MGILYLQLIDMLVFFIDFVIRFEKGNKKKKT